MAFGKMRLGIGMQRRSPYCGVAGGVLRRAAEETVGASDGAEASRARFDLISISSDAITTSGPWIDRLGPVAGQIDLIVRWMPRALSCGPAPLRWTVSGLRVAVCGCAVFPYSAAGQRARLAAALERLVATKKEQLIVRDGGFFDKNPFRERLDLLHQEDALARPRPASWILTNSPGSLRRHSRCTVRH
jgi:hypothetical protein